MSVVEKIQRGILVALETPGYWRDYSEAYRAVTSKYQPHQGKQECARRRCRGARLGSGVQFLENQGTL